MSSSAQVLEAANARGPAPEFGVAHHAVQFRPFPLSTSRASVNVMRLHQRLNEFVQASSGVGVPVFAVREEEPIFAEYAGDVPPEDLAALKALAGSIDLPASIQVSKLLEEDPRYQVW